MFRRRIVTAVTVIALSVSLLSIYPITSSAEVMDIDINKTLKTTRTMSEYNTSFLSVTGYAKGVVNDRTEYIGTEKYRVVTNGDEFVKALQDAQSGEVKVIEVNGDINLGYNELSEASRNLGCVTRYEDPTSGYSTGKYTNPTILQSGMSKISVDRTKGLTVFSKAGNTIRHAEFKLQYGSEDIIFRNIEFDDCWQWDEAGTHKEVGWSFFKVNGAKNVWLDHCTFSIGADAIIDLENASSGVTYSWCRFSLETKIPERYSPIYKTITYMEYLYSNNKADTEGRYYKIRKSGATPEELMKYESFHSKGFGAGNEKQFKDIGSGNIPEDSAQRVRLTFAYDYFTNIGQRLPRLSVGRTHMFNIFVDDMGHMTLHNSTNYFKGYGGLSANLCLNPHTSASVAADTCIFYGVNEVVAGNEHQGIDTGTGLASNTVLNNAWQNAKNRALVVNSKVTNLNGDTYTGSSWDNNGDNLFTKGGYTWYDKSTIGNWVWQSNIVGVENMVRDNPPADPFIFVDDEKSTLGYDYQVVPLDEVEDVLKTYAGAYKYNMSEENWLKVEYDSNADIKAVDSSKNIKSTAVKIRQQDQILPVNSVFQIDADVSPGHVTNRNVNYTSSDPTTMEVKDSGLVIVHKSGSAVITAEAADGSGCTDSVTLTAEVAVESLILEGKTKTVYTGQTVQLGYAVGPDNAAHKDVKFSSSDTSILMVDDSGVITPLKEGISIVSCSSVDNPSIKATIRVTVKKGSAGTEPQDTEIPEYKKGDINADTKVDAKDALAVLKHAAKQEFLNEKEQLAADVNNDTKADAKDALLILKLAVKIIYEFPNR